VAPLRFGWRTPAAAAARFDSYNARAAPGRLACYALDTVCWSSAGRN
jgi:hypothetical protein